MGELWGSIDCEAEADRFRSRVEAALNKDLAIDVAYRRYIGSRLNSKKCGLRVPVARAIGHRSDYAMSLQRLSFVAQVVHEDDVADAFEGAVEDLRRFAPDPDRGILLSGVSLPYFVTWASGWWTMRSRRDAGEGSETEALNESRAAARGDLLAALGRANVRRAVEA
ncbi:MAG: hypothetical protein AAF360_02340 [Pseudomonadota bacterium]